LAIHAKILAYLAAFLAFVTLSARVCQADVQIQSAVFSTTTDLGATTFNWDIALKPGPGGNFNIQLFLQDLSHPGQYITVNPGLGTVLELFPDSDNRGSFTVNLPVGHYGNGKAVLFAAASNYMAALPDIPVSGLDTKVTTSQIRVTKPEIDVDSSKVQVGADGKEHIPFAVKEPAGAAAVKGGGYWAMAKGTGGFSQIFLDAKNFKPSGNANDNYLVYSGEFAVASPGAAGLYNVNIGLLIPHGKSWPGSTPASITRSATG